MTDETPRWNGDPDGVDHFLWTVTGRQSPSTDPLASALAAAAGNTGDTEPRAEERFLAEFRAAEPKPSPREPRRRARRIAIPAALATLTISGVALAADLPAAPPVSPQLRTTAVMSTPVSTPTATHDFVAPPPATSVTQQDETQTPAGPPSHGTGPGKKTPVAAHEHRSGKNPARRGRHAPNCSHPE